MDLITFDFKFIIVAVVFIMFDIITGLVAACVTGTYQSKVMRQGGIRKLMLIVAIGFGVALDISQQMIDLGFSIPATTAICGYIALMEIMSCLENINKGFPDALPSSITSILSSKAKEYGIDSKEKDDE